jgi:hypothetical protein
LSRAARVNADRSLPQKPARTPQLCGIVTFALRSFSSRRLARRCRTTSRSSRPPWRTLNADTLVISASCHYQ